ncbi:hypothetical protein OA385_01590 [Paracoccaceae bacterium]|nr:hypothetical protein [Paracoccaceae bacterium]
MKTLNSLLVLISLTLSVTTAFSQSSISAGVSYGSFSYEVSGTTKYTGDGGVLSLDGQLSPSIAYSLSMGDGKFDDVVFNDSQGSITYNVYPNIGVHFMGSQIKLATVQETDTSLGISYNIDTSSLGIKVFAGSDINNYGKFFTYGTDIDLGIAQGSSLSLSYKTEDRKQKATSMNIKFVYDLASNLGLNLGYRSTETKDATGNAVALKGNTTYAGIIYKF